jgi:hypothetical protein
VLHHPAMASQPPAGLDSPAGDARNDAPAAQEGSQMGIVVTLVTVEFARPATSWPAAGADRRDAANQRLQRQAVVDVGGADRDRDGRTGPLGDEVDLRPVLAAIDKIRICQLSL